MEKFLNVLQAQHQQQFTGELLVHTDHQEWQLYFLLGRLLYATGGKHRVRRWYRVLKRQSPSFIGQIEQSPAEEPWEYELLRRGVAQGQIRTTQARSIIQASVLEVLFELLREQNFSYQQLSRQLPWRIILPHVEQVIEDASQLQAQWEMMGLREFSPNLAPLLVDTRPLQTQVGADVFQILVRLLDGQHSLWDIAGQMQRPITTLTRSLIPLLRQGLMKLQEIPDLPCPVSQTRVAPIVASSKYLLACIDDSPAIGKALEQILLPAGYTVFSVLDPLRAVTILLERKPNLIFLDLVMPNTNGYELCSFLRKTSVFRATPIVILTGQDGIIDRVRAKMAGCSDFVSKPPEAEKVLQIVNQYLSSSVPTPRCISSRIC